MKTASISSGFGSAIPFAEPKRIAELMAEFPHPWAVCGGWAVDLFLAERTRVHKDVDIAVLRRDQAAIREYLTERGWRLEKAQDGRLIPWERGEYIEPPVHGIWCRNATHAPDFLEVLLNEADETHFRFRRDLSITLELDRAFLRTASGLPILAPEIVLLYKSKAHADPNNRADFERCLPALSAEQREWLRAALVRTDAGHPWLSSM